MLAANKWIQLTAWLKYIPSDLHNCTVLFSMGRFSNETAVQMGMLCYASISMFRIMHRNILKCKGLENNFYGCVTFTWIICFVVQYPAYEKGCISYSFSVSWKPLPPQLGVSSVCGWRRLPLDVEGGSGMCWISSMENLNGCWARGLTTHHCKNTACYEILHNSLDLDIFFGMT
jgi:hypothetical protein